MRPAQAWLFCYILLLKELMAVWFCILMAKTSKRSRSLRAFVLATFQHFVLIWVVLAFYCLGSPIASLSLSVLGLYVQIVALLCCACVLVAFTLIGILFLRVAVWFCIGRMLLAVALSLSYTDASVTRMRCRASCDHEHVGTISATADTCQTLSHILLRYICGSIAPLHRYLRRSRAGIRFGVAAGLVLRRRTWA